MFDFAEITNDMSEIEILNYYRNLYYTEPQVTERGIVANAINDMFDLINRQKLEIEELKNYINRCKSGKEYWVKCLLEKPNEAIKEFAERLKGEIKREKESGNELLSEIYDRDIQMNAEGEKTAYDNVERIVDNLLKEMVGEEE